MGAIRRNAIYRQGQHGTVRRVGDRSWNEPAAIASILSTCPLHAPGPQDVHWLDLPPASAVALSSDSITEDQAFPGEDVRSLVRRGLNEALSDLAAAGAEPLGVQVDLRAPRDFTLPDFAAVGAGLHDALQEHGGLLLQGSNVTQGQFGSSFTVVGITTHQRRLNRSGARIGDDIYISGPTGGWNGALAIMNLGNAQLNDEEWTATRDAFLDYGPELKYGQRLAQTDVVHCCTDANDSLDKCLRDLLIPYGLGARIDEARIPLDAVTHLAARECGESPIPLAIFGLAGDNRLIFTVSRDDSEHLRAALSSSGFTAHWIGTVTTDTEVAYKTLSPRSHRDDDRTVSIYSPVFWAPIPLISPYYGPGGRSFSSSRGRGWRDGN